MLSMVLAVVTGAIDDLFGEYFQPFKNSLLYITTYVIIVLLPMSLGIYYKNKKTTS